MQKLPATWQVPSRLLPFQQQGVMGYPVRLLIHLIWAFTLVIKPVM
jgi:hypothetical protein